MRNKSKGIKLITSNGMAQIRRSFYFQDISAYVNVAY